MDFTETNFAEIKAASKYNAKANAHYNELTNELALRSNNYSVGSKLGGNASELFFLFTHDVKFAPSPDELSHIVSNLSEDVVFQFPKGKMDIKQLREELTRFISSHPEKNDFTEKQVTDIDFIKSNIDKNTFHTDLLMRYLEECEKLKTSLEPKLKINKVIEEVFKLEKDNLIKSFLKEMRLEEDFFTKLNLTDDDTKIGSKITSMMYKHPTWGLQYKNIEDRAARIYKEIISQEEINLIKFIDSFPSPIKILSVRMKLGIEFMINFNIDEHFTIPFKDE